MTQLILSFTKKVNGFLLIHVVFFIGLRFNFLSIILDEKKDSDYIYSHSKIKLEILKNNFKRK